MSASRSSKKTSGKSRRSFVVLLGLVGSLSMTCALLMALAPAPLTPDAANTLFAVEGPSTWDVIFQTKTPVATSRWKYIYVHHSNTPGGNAFQLGRDSGGLGDHFVIGNGDGCGDGEIQIGQRWNRQQSALPPQGASSVRADCISICLVGDFDQNRPTATQVTRAGQLISALQSRLGIPAERVLLIETAPQAAGLGKHFPAREIKSRLLP